MWRLAILALAVSVAAIVVVDRYKQQRTFHDILTIRVPAAPNTARAWGRIPNRAVEKAERFWGRSRCAAPPRLLYRRLADDHAAEAHWGYLSPAPQVYLNCEIVFSLRKLPFRLYCAAMIHEYGHLAGFSEGGAAHSRNPANVMYPSISARNVPRTCENR